MYRYELKNFRGDVRQVINDVKSRENINGTIEYTANVIQSSDSYPFGWDIKERSFSTDQYRFSFNGKENDTDWGNQHIQDYGFRLYNPALAKFLSVDPLAPEFPWYTPYQFAGNMPIWAIDLDGLEPTIMIGGEYGDPNPSISNKSIIEELWAKFKNGEQNGTLSQVTAADIEHAAGHLESTTNSGFTLTSQNIRRYIQGRGGYYIYGINELINAKGIGTFKRSLDKYTEEIVERSRINWEGKEGVRQFGFIEGFSNSGSSARASNNDVFAALGSHRLSVTVDLEVSGDDKDAVVSGRIYFTLSDEYRWHSKRYLSKALGIDHDAFIRLQELGAANFWIRSYFYVDVTTDENGEIQYSEYKDVKDLDNNVELPENHSYGKPSDTRLMINGSGVKTD